MNVKKITDNFLKYIDKLFIYKKNDDINVNFYKKIVENTNIIEKINFLSNDYKNIPKNYKCFMYKYNKYIKIKIYINNDINLDNDIKKIRKILNYYKELYKNNIIDKKNWKNKLVIHIYFINYKKTFLKDLNFDNINSGITMYNDIIIFKKEEYIKVLIHELIHFYKKDFKYLYNYQNKYIKVISSLKIIDNIININESFVECITFIIYIILLSNDKEDFIKKFILEIDYSYLLLKKLLIVNNKNNNNIQNDIFYYYQDTHVFSYYILKYLLLDKIDIIIKIFLNYKNKSYKYLENKYLKIVDETISSKILFNIEQNQILDIYGDTLKMMYHKFLI